MKIILLVVKYYFLVVALSFIVEMTGVTAITPRGIWAIIVGIFVLFGLIYNHLKENDEQMSTLEIFIIGGAISIEYIASYWFLKSQFGISIYPSGFEIIGAAGLSIFLVALVYTLRNLSLRILADVPTEEEC